MAGSSLMLSRECSNHVWFGFFHIQARFKTGQAWQDALKLADYACENWYKLTMSKEQDSIYDDLKFLSLRV